MTLEEAAAALRRVPGVRDAIIVFCETAIGGKKTVAYVAPDNMQMEALLLGGEEERKRLQKWRKAFDLTQLGREAATAPVGFNIAGWNSSYTRQPIPVEAMREWVEETVKSIHSLQPREVLEIGCGSGLLLLRVAPACDRYVGTDFSPATLRRLQEQLAKFETPVRNVVLFELPADNLEDFAADSFDTVILNSVVQYFPGPAYLFRVLEKLVGVLKPGGKIFLGDVRSLPLLDVYAFSVEFFQASPAMPLSELRERVRKRAQNQGELLLSPSFFLALQSRLPEISRVEVRPKRGRGDNELTRFRFDAVLHVGSELGQASDQDWRDWPEEGLSLPAIRQMLEDPKRECLALRGVPNARIQEDLVAMRELERRENTGTVAELRSFVQDKKTLGIHPQDLQELADQLGFPFNWSCLNSRSDGAFDLVFWRPSPRNESRNILWPRPLYKSTVLAQHCSNPVKASFAEKLIPMLGAFSAEKLPEEVRPAEFRIVESIPATPCSENPRI